MNIESINIEIARLKSELEALEDYHKDLRAGHVADAEPGEKNRVKKAINRTKSEIRTLEKKRKKL